MPITRNRPGLSLWVIVGRIVACLATAVCLGIVLARAAELQFGPLVFLVALTPYFAGVALVALLISLLTRLWAVAALAAVSLGLISFWWLPPFINNPPPTSGQAIAVATANLKFGKGDACTLVALARTQQVDLLSVQELTPDAVPGLRACGIDELLPYSFIDPGTSASGSGMWSRYPLTQGAKLPGMLFENLRATVALPSGPATWFTVHPVAPGPMEHRRWENDSRNLIATLEAAAGPTIASGDFNATRDQFPLLALERAGYVDAVTAAGSGFTPTFPADGSLPIPVVGLDHVMTRDWRYVATATETARIPGSDHLCLVAQFAMPSEG